MVLSYGLLLLPWMSTTTITYGDNNHSRGHHRPEQTFILFSTTTTATPQSPLPPSASTEWPPQQSLSQIFLRKPHGPPLYSGPLPLYEWPSSWWQAQPTFPTRSFIHVVSLHQLFPTFCFEHFSYQLQLMWV